MPIRFLINIVVVVNFFVISIWIMNINILRYFLFGIAGGQEVEHLLNFNDRLKNSLTSFLNLRIEFLFAVLNKLKTIFSRLSS